MKMTCLRNKAAYTAIYTYEKRPILMKRDQQKRPHTTRDLYRRLMKKTCLRNKADSMSETGQGWVLISMKNYLHI